MCHSVRHSVHCSFGFCYPQKRRKSDAADSDEEKDKENRSGDDSSRRKRQRVRATQSDVLKLLDAQMESLAESDKVLFAKVDAFAAQDKERLDFEKERAKKQEDFNNRYLMIMADLVKAR